MRITLLSALIPTFAVTTSAFTPFHCATRVSTGRSSFTRQVTSLRLYESNIGSTVKTVFASVDEVLKNVVSNLDNINLAINEETEGLLRDLLSEIQTILSDGTIIQQEFVRYTTSSLKEIDQWLITQNPMVESLFRQIVDQLSATTVNTPEVVGISTVITYFVVTSILTWDEAPPPSKPYPLQRYDPVAAQAYFDGRTVEFVSRALEIAIKSLKFGLKVLRDQVR